MNLSNAQNDDTKKIEGSKTAAVALDSIAGKKICIDPGHGGKETGAVGVQGVVERDINLTVSLFLKEMLEKDGAIVIMTRDKDVDVKLQDRGKINKENKTDLFVSVHHNANAQGDTKMNRRESFYHWKDRGGPSEDIARLVLKEMQREEIRPNSKAYMCWAYGVLRENAYPAMLAEYSYLQNPEEEERLKDKEYLKKEAESYYRAIKSFFDGGKPYIVLEDIDLLQKGILIALVGRKDNSALIDPQSIRITINENEIETWAFDTKTNQIYCKFDTYGLPAKSVIIVTARNLADHVSNICYNEFTPQANTGIQTNMTDDSKLLIYTNSDNKKVPVNNAYAAGPDINGPFGVSENGIVYKKPGKSDTIERLSIYANGYAPFEAEKISYSTNEVEIKPLYKSVLLGKKIVLDPEGGGDFPVAEGQNGLRASDVNLKTGIYLYEYLKRAGADVTMTRKIDMSMDNVSRVRTGLLKDPEIFVTIGHRMPEPGMKEQPGENFSRIGKRWDTEESISKSFIYHLKHLLGTGKIADANDRDPVKDKETVAWSSWEAMHAAQNYKSAYIVPLMFDIPANQKRLETTSGCRKEALALFYGMLTYFGLDDRNMASAEGTVIDKKSGKNLKDALVTIDSFLTVQTEEDGKFILKFLEPGEHKITVKCFGYPDTVKTITVKDKEIAPVKIEM